ncbi:MAG: alpha/beta hydrolase [Acidobacteriota bacterium]|nr:alpha/beta hydrolase [Acidobacteriota bacterium]
MLSTRWSWMILLAAAAAPAAELELQPCEIPGFAGAARCGTYEVFENRAAMAGRTIPLNVVVLPARGESPAPDPLVFFAGGPGGSTVEMAPGLATFMAAELERRDFLLVDYRGTGKSKPLFCPYQKELQRGITEALETFLPVDLLEECAAALEEDADLTQYTTPNIVDDVAQVARALGYEKVNLSGGSYGSRAALVFMRRHPEMVRTAVIEGVVPTDVRMPVTLAADAQAALDGWFRECAEDADCAAAFPDPEADLATVLAELDAGAKTIAVTDPGTRETVELTLSRNALVQTLRYMLYSSMSALRIPAFLHAAAGGDWEPMAQTAYSVGGLLMVSIPDGLYLSVTCAEDVSRIGPNAAAIQTGFLGDFRLRQQVAACGKWLAAELPAGYHDPVESTVPVLIISGERDPATPARCGYEAQEFLPASVHLVVPDGAHGWFGLSGIKCIDELQSRFLETASVEGLGVDGCVAGIARPPFLLAVPREEEIEMSREALERFAGVYAAEAGGIQAVFEVTDEGLMVTFGQDVRRFVPLAALRFKIDGDPSGNVFEFVERDGEIVAFEVMSAGTSQLQLIKQ